MMRLPWHARAALLLLVASSGTRALAAQSPVERVERAMHALMPQLQGGQKGSPATIEQEMVRLHVPGISVAIVVDGKIAWARGYGVKEFGKPAPVDTTTLFLAGSISKPVFTSGFLALVEEKKVALDTDVNASLKSWHLPDSPFTTKEKVTLRRILSHSAGLTVWGFPGYDATAPVPTVPQLLDGASPANTAAVRNDTIPGARWLYSGGGITIAQLVATDVTGETFPALMKRLVFDRVGMTRSTFENPLPAARAGEAASGHERIDTPVPGRFHTYPEMAAAGLWTTAPELARWGIAMMQAYRGERSTPISTAMTREMMRPQVALPRSGPGSRPNGGWWGLGIAIGGSDRNFNFSHGGRDEGFVGVVSMWPERNVGIAVLVNGVNGNLAGEMLDAFAAEFAGTDPRK